VARFSFAAAFAVLAVSTSAWAEDSTEAKNWNDAKVAELPATLKVPTHVLASVGSGDATVQRAKKKKSASQCNANGCGYKALLTGLPLARDIEASPSVAVRVLPTAHALSGSDAAQPILVRPRVDGSGNMGVHLRAKF